MLLDLNDPESILRWWAVYPARHGALLNDWSQRRPEYRASIARARALIKDDPDLRAAFARSRTSAGHLPDVDADAPVLSHDEIAASALEH